MSYKRKIIPEEMKQNIDEILESQLFNANRYYAESNPNIFRLMEQELQKRPSEFLKELKSRWNWHNLFYEELLEPAFLELGSNDYMEITPQQLSDLIEIYKTCCLVDEATLVLSGAIKKYLQKNLNTMINFPINSSSEKKEEIFMLLTPPIDTFFTQYYIDHISYIILTKSDPIKARKFKEYLLKQYHANDEKIFENRCKKFSSFINKTEEELLEDISKYKISNEYRIKHFYFTLENPEKKAYRDIIIYDNLNEKLISSQLIGISGFLLRKKILKYLNDSKILLNMGYIYEFSNEEIINSLKKMSEDRKMIMIKNIRPYKQNGLTCAIACMLMVLEYYKIIPKANKLYEKRYFKLYRSNYLDGTPLSALAWHFAKNGLDTEIVHSEKDIFKNDETFSDDLFEKTLQEYKKFLQNAKEKGAKISTGMTITCEILMEKLKENNLIILAGQCGSYLHTILLCGYEGDNFVVCDPLYNDKKLMSFAEIEKFMNTSIGKWYVAVKEYTSKKENLMKNLAYFQISAKNKLEQNESLKKRIIK